MLIMMTTRNGLSVRGLHHGPVGKSHVCLAARLASCRKILNFCNGLNLVRMECGFHMRAKGYVTVCMNDDAARLQFGVSRAHALLNINISTNFTNSITRHGCIVNSCTPPWIAAEFLRYAVRFFLIRCSLELSHLSF